MAHLFVDISSHGLGHLAQVAPVLNELTHRRPDLRLTIRSGVPTEKLRARLRYDFTHIAERSDYGYVMLDAVRIDFASTAAAYRAQHADWAQRVAEEARQIAALEADVVLTDVAYLPLAGAAQSGIPSLSMCSLNWADLFAHFFGHESWAPEIHRQMLDAYRSAETFMRLTPAMPMMDFPRRQTISPVAAVGQDRRAELRDRLGIASDAKLALVAFGGFDKSLGAEHWTQIPGLHWLIPETWQIRRKDMAGTESLGAGQCDQHVAPADDGCVRRQVQRVGVGRQGPPDAEGVAERLLHPGDRRELFQTVTLAQVFWMKDSAGQPARFFVGSESELSIAADFSHFGADLTQLRKRLRDRGASLHDSFPPYAAWFRRRFGIDNDQALELFHQTVSMKSVGNLTDFVRSHMLEPFDVAPRIQ